MMDIIEKIVNGDKKAFECFYSETHAKLFAFVYSRTNNEYLSQEILQNAYVTLWEKRTSVKSKRYYFEAYLFKIVRNAIIAEYKRKIREQKAKLHFEQIRKANENTETQIVRGVVIDDIKVENILKNLPERQRQVFQLVKIQELSHIEAANELELSKRTVESHLRQAIIKLRNLFNII